MAWGWGLGKTGTCGKAAVVEVAFAGSEGSQVFGDTGLFFWPSVLLIRQRDARKGLE